MLNSTNMAKIFSLILLSMIFTISVHAGNEKRMSDLELYNLYLKEKDISDNLQNKLNQNDELGIQLLPYEARKKYGIYTIIERYHPKNDADFIYYLKYPESFFIFYLEGGMLVTPSNLRLDQIEKNHEKSHFGAKIRVNRLRMILKHVELPFDECEGCGLSLDSVRSGLVEGVQIYGKDNIDLRGFKNDFVSFLKAQAVTDLENAERIAQKLKHAEEEIHKGILQSYAKPAEVNEFYEEYISDIEKLFLVNSYYELLKEDQKAFLDNLVSNLRNLSGKFRMYTSQSFGYYGDRSLFIRLQEFAEHDKHFAHEAIKVLVENMDNYTKSNVTLDEQPIYVGVMCYEALSNIVEISVPQDDTSTSVGIVLPTATREDLAAAKNFWERLVKYKSYVLR